MALCAAAKGMTAAEDFAAGVARRAAAKLSLSNVRSEMFRIGGVRFQVIGAAPQRERWLGQAFFPNIEASHGEAQDVHQTMFWDGIDATSLPPERPWGPAGHMPLGVVTEFSNDKVRCAFDIHVGSLLVYDFVANASYTWFANVAELPPWAAASPFRVLLSWLCNLRGMQIVHGGAVAIDGRAVLLAGPGGAGKSTTALACVLAGLGYIGDDYCAVEPATGDVHMVYRTAKLFKSSLEMLPSLARMVVNRGRIADEKGVLYLDPGEMNLVRSAKLSAILLTVVGASARSMVRPATRAETIKAILPSTVGGLMGGTAVTTRMIMELARSVPAFHVELGTDLDSVVEAVTTSLRQP